jgi:hypothetical protein
MMLRSDYIDFVGTQENLGKNHEQPQAVNFGCG